MCIDIVKEVHMKWAVYLMFLGLFALPLRADFQENMQDEFAVEEGIEEIFAECLEEVRSGQRKRIELYTCVNLGLQKKKAEARAEEAEQ